MTRFGPKDRRAALLVAITSLVCAFALSRRASVSAARDAGAARADHAAMLAEARRALDLASQRPIIADRPRPEPDLVARVGSALAEAGISPDKLARLTLSEPRAVAASAGGNSRGAPTGLKSQSATLAVESVTAGDAARALTRFREAEPLWTVKSIRLDHVGKDGDLYDVTAVIESVHLAPGTVPAAAVGVSERRDRGWTLSLADESPTRPRRANP